MLTFDKFSGINNVLPSERLKPRELSEAVNVDVGLDNELSRRSGFQVANQTCHKNLWQGKGFMLATSSGDLIAVDGSTLYPSLGIERVWYCNLPDGRTSFSNGLINGLTDGTTTTTWGVPCPEHQGIMLSQPGDLYPGEYRVKTTHVRLSDGLESGTTDYGPVELTEGGFLLSGLPELDGHKLNIYVSSHNDETFYLAGSTTSAAFSFTGKNDTLVLPCRTDNLLPPPIGTVTATFGSRVLIAQGKVLWATLPHQPELCDVRRDFKVFEDNITLIQSVSGGVYVGTTAALYFLQGDTFDTLRLSTAITSGVVLGSGVAVPGEKIQLGDGVGSGKAMICICGGYLTAGFGNGQTVQMTKDRYKTPTNEVAATFRIINGIPQYLAVMQDGSS